MKGDISNKGDVTMLVTQFYDRLLDDPVTKPIFDHLNMEEHLPTIINFWCMVLFGDNAYKGNPFNKHVGLGLKASHFERWLFHFETTIDEHFAGEKAELARQRANSIAFIFKSKLGI